MEVIHAINVRILFNLLTKRAPPSYRLIRISSVFIEYCGVKEEIIGRKYPDYTVDVQNDLCMRIFHLLEDTRSVDEAPL